MTEYECEYCGKTAEAESARNLPSGSCPGRDYDYDDHVWVPEGGLL